MFSDLLRQDRDRSGLSLDEAARRLRFSPERLWELEGGTAWPDWETYDRIATTFGWPRSFR
jgi:transcriptional regulator with XRE-family HTH domain